jgi:hypothetical protein
VIKEDNMKKYVMTMWLCLLWLVSACSTEMIPPNEPTQAALPPAEIVVSPDKPYHPLDTMTQIAEIDLVLYAVASGDPQQLRDLFEYSQIACQTVNALGGPPPCRAGEAEGTIVEVLPSLGPEGSYLRKDEVDNFPGLNVIGVYAVYQVSDTAYSEVNFPAGEYAIMYTAPDHVPGIVLQIRSGRIIRIDYVFDPSSFEVILQRDASRVILDPTSK